MTDSLKKPRRQLDFTAYEDLNDKKLNLLVQEYWHKTGGGLAMRLKLTKQQYDDFPSEIKKPGKLEHDFGWAEVEII